MRRTPLAIAITVATLCLPRLGAAQEHAHPCPAGEECPRPADHEAMMARHEAMMERHEAAAARIQELQDRMHEASGDARIDAIVALLDEMLAQNRAMHEMMKESHHPMGMEHGGMKHEGMEPDDEDR